MEFEIRPATSTDVPWVMAIAREAELSRWSVQDYEAEIERPEAIFLVACHNDRQLVFGFVVGRLVIAADKDEFFDLEIYNIGVAKNYRRKGIGGELFAHLTKFCKQRDVRKCWLEVRSKNQTAIEFYEHLDFKTETVRRGYYRDPSDDANIMSTIL